MNLKAIITTHFWSAALLVVSVWFILGQALTRGSEKDSAEGGVHEVTANISKGTSLDHPAFFGTPQVAAAQSLPETSLMMMGTVGLMLLMIRAGRALRQGRSVQLR